MRALALALALAAAPPWEGSSAPPYRVMDVLKPLCINLKAKPQAVLTAALAAGYRPDPDNETQVNLVSEKGSIALLAGVGHLPADKIAGPREVDTCMIFLLPGKDQEADLFAWLGIKEPRPPLPWSYLLAEGPNGPRIIRQKDRDGEERAFAAGTLRLLKFEPMSPEGLHVIYGVVRDPAPPVRDSDVPRTRHPGDHANDDRLVIGRLWPVHGLVPILPGRQPRRQ